MRLVQLSTASMLGCALGLAALIGATLWGYSQMHAKQAQITELLTLQKRLDDLSAGSDSLLLFGADARLHEAFLADAAETRRRLLALGDEHPEARTAAREIELIIEALADAQALTAPGGGAKGTGGAEYGGPLDLPLRARIVMNQVASHGVALDTALDQLLRDRQQTIARQAEWIAGAFAAIALLFAALAMIAFGLIHRRIGAPVRELAATMKQVERGQRTARAPADGDDELAGLGRALNELLDYQHDAEEQLQQYRRLIESSSDRFCIIDEGHCYVLASDGYAALYGLDSASLEGRHLLDVLTPTFYEREARPRIDRCLAGEPQSFEAERTYPALGTRQFLIRYFPLTPTDEDTRQVGSVMTDITEVRTTERTMQEQARLLDMAGRLARVGGWSVDLDSHRIVWSDQVADIHGMPHGHSPGFEEGVRFYAPEYRDTIRECFRACTEEGQPFDRELQIIDTGGERVWIRAVGEPVRDDTGRIHRVQGAFQDITARKAADAELERLNTWVANILESITDAFFTLDTDWRFAYVNSAAARLLGRAPDALIGHEFWQEYPAALGSAIEREYRRAMRERVTVSLEQYFPPLEKWFESRAYPTEQGLAVYFRDVSQRHAAEAALQAREEELRASRDELAETLRTRQRLVNALPAHIALLDRDSTILDVNDQWRHFGEDNEGTDPAMGVGSNYLAVCDAATGECAETAAEARAGLQAVLAGERDTFTLEYPCHSPNQARWFRLMANRLGDDTTTGAVVMHVDITERKLAEQELNRLAYQDALTGLASRNGFLHALADRLKARGWPPQGAVVMLDIERHRDINDTHGYSAGDRVLCEVGERLGAAVGTDGLIGRVGGDEFVLFLADASGSAYGRVAAAFDTAFPIEQGVVEAAAKFGYTRLGESPRAVEELMREAELALFESEGGDGWSAYSEALDRVAHERVDITRELRRALKEGEFALHYQPKVRLDTGGLVASEALLRWQHPELGLRPPSLFIPIAEQSQLIGPIGDWALDEACRSLRDWHAAGLEVVRVAVNVSVVQFMLGDFTETVRATLARHGVPPGALTLEITESVFERESESLNRQLRALHDMGVRLSLDDFGTGYSSLLYLQKYPFDEIKIDQGFVRHMQDDEYSRQIVRTVIGVAGALGAEVVAEGIETTAERDALLTMDCRIGQGYYYSMPLDAEDFRWLLERRTALPLALSGG